jgi:hypothetical protein
MVLENLGRYKVETTKEAVTSFAGLPLFLEMGQVLGLEKKLNGLDVKERDRGFKPAEVGFSLMGLIQAGGIALDDMDLLRGDEGMKRVIPGLPAANTVGEFLRRFVNRTLYGLGRIVVNTAVQVIRVLRLKQVTLDIDAFTLESKKWNAEWNYKGEKGFTPVMVTCAELKMPMAGIWRRGAASPQANLVWLLKRVMERLCGIKLTVRSDSAGYQGKLVRLCEERKADFTITADKDKAVMETIKAIPEKNWRRYEDTAWPNRIQEIAETVHAMGEKKTEAHRLVVVRWRRPGAELFEYDYHAVFTNRAGAGEEILRFHRQRQDKNENVNKEMVYGFGLEKLPCREMKPNAAYFQMAMLSAIVATAVKVLTLPESWWSYTMKTLRFKLIRLAGFVSRHARSLWLKIPSGYACRKIFEEARWRILGLASELTPSTA